MARPWPAMTRSVASLISAMEMAFLFRRAARMADLIGLAQGVGGEGRILSIYLSIYPSLYVYMYNMYVYVYIYIYIYIYISQTRNRILRPWNYSTLANQESYI